MRRVRLWPGLKCEPVYCDIDPISQQMSADLVRRLLDAGGISGILGVHLWGGAAPIEVLQGLAEVIGVPLYYDSAHAFGVKTNDGAIGRYGRAEVLSFDALNMLGTGEGGCITTNDDVLAAKFVAMRGDEVAPAKDLHAVGHRAHVGNPGGHRTDDA